MNRHIHRHRPGRQAGATGSGQQGFSLVELVIVIAIFGVVATAIIASYQSQQFSYLRQEKTVEAQQNIRAALFFLERDIRRLGYDPSQRSAAATSTSMLALVDELRFVWDGNENGEIENTEIIRYALAPTSPASDTTAVTASTGQCPSGTPCSLKRVLGPGSGVSVSAVADNIEALEFFYHFADGTTATECTSQTQRENIRSIDVSILVRSSKTVRMFRDTSTYISASGTAWGPFNDGYVRCMMIANIKCRNMGLSG